MRGQPISRLDFLIKRISIQRYCPLADLKKCSGANLRVVVTVKITHTVQKTARIIRGYRKDDSILLYYILQLSTTADVYKSPFDNFFN